MADIMEERRNLEGKLITRALKDKEFRSLLRKDPKAAIQQELGVIVPSSVEVSVLEEQPRKYYLVIPAQASDLEQDRKTADADSSGGKGPHIMCHLTTKQWGGTC